MTEYTELKSQELEERAEIDITKVTLYKYKRIARYMVDFLQFRRGVKNVSVGNLDGEFPKQLFLYLRKEKNCLIIPLCAAELSQNDFKGAKSKRNYKKILIINFRLNKNRFIEIFSKRKKLKEYSR
ncbi:MAG: hypothetical protein ABIN94_12250 [Ferruginibacter sp.]